MIGVYNYTVILTYIGLGSSLFGIMETLQGNCKIGILCLVLSGACDMFDGKIARTKKDRTDDEKRFGIQIDSLCDLVCFGAFPAIIGYSVGLRSLWERAVLILYVISAVIRLAYFNIMEEKRQEKTTTVRKYYEGLPVTSTAIIFPVIYFFRAHSNPHVFPYIYLAGIILVGILFISKIKVIKPGNKAIIAFVAVGGLIILKILKVI